MNIAHNAKNDLDHLGCIIGISTSETVIPGARINNFQLHPLTANKRHYTMPVLFLRQSSNAETQIKHPCSTLTGSMGA
jgi:hypothetical protein